MERKTHCRKHIWHFVESYAHPRRNSLGGYGSQSIYRCERCGKKGQSINGGPIRTNWK